MSGVSYDCHGRHMVAWSIPYNTHESPNHSSFRNRCTRRCIVKALLSRCRQSTMAITSAMKAMKASKAMKATKATHRPATITKVHFAADGSKTSTSGRKLKWVTVSAPAYISGGESPSLVGLAHVHDSVSHMTRRSYTSHPCCRFIHTCTYRGCNTHIPQVDRRTSRRSGNLWVTTQRNPRLLTRQRRD